MDRDNRDRSEQWWTERAKQLRELHVDPALFEQLVTGSLSRFASVVRRAPQRDLTEPDLLLLSEGGLDTSPIADEDLRRVVAIQVKTALLLANSWSLREAQQSVPSLGEISTLVRDHKVYAFRDPAGDERIPKFQFVRGLPLPGLGTVVPAIPVGAHPVEVATFFTSPDPNLEIEGEAISPVAWLLSSGDPEPVAALAAEL